MRGNVLIRWRRTVAGASAAAAVLAGVAAAGARAATPAVAQARPGPAAQATSPGAHHPHYLRPLQPPPVALPVGVGVPAAGQPMPVNMAYFGGPVLVHPRIYLIFWGWHGDPNGVARDLISFFQGVGGSSWEGVVDQYYETVGGRNISITNPGGQLAGVWFDNVDPIHNNLSDGEIAAEAARGVRHFTGRPDPEADYLVATPSYANTAGFNKGQYCAYHDYTTPKYYPGVMPGIQFTNMPYVLNQGANCGENLVNPGAAGRLDGVTLAAGHEYLETITDPGAEDPGIGGWYDFDGYENGDKCAYVTLGPGAATDITLPTGTFAVQGTWSNDALDGAGWCANSS